LYLSINVRSARYIDHETAHIGSVDSIPHAEFFAANMTNDFGSALLEDLAEALLWMGIRSRHSLLGRNYMTLWPVHFAVVGPLAFDNSVRSVPHSLVDNLLQSMLAG
jgi:hypothetical protein